MLVDEKLITYLEDLSFITLSGEERGRICADLENILAGMELLSKLDCTQEAEQYPGTNASPEAMVLPGSAERQAVSLGFRTDLRKDEVAPSFPRGEILKNSPEAKGGTFVVPKTVE